MGMICNVYAVPEEDLERLAHDPNFFGELTRYDNPEATPCSLEKAWHGLHYLLSGDAWKATGPLTFIVAGGSEDRRLRWRIRSRAIVRAR